MMQAWLDAIGLWHWFALTALLLGGIWLASAHVLLGAAMAALLVGMVLAVGPALSWATQFFLFATFAVVFSFMHQRQVRRSTAQASPNPVQTPTDLIGQTFLLDHSLPLGHGTLQIGTQNWQVHCAESLAPGRRIKVVGMDGAILKVIPLDMQ